MAKGKQAAALFEVIHSSKKPGLLRTPRWWFKGRPSAMNAPADSVHAADPTPIIPPASSYYEAPPSELPRAHLHLDRQRKQFTMRMSTSTALVGGFAVAVALGLAYVVGQHVAGGPKSATASDVTTDVIRQQPAAPNTLDVPRHIAKPTPIQKSASGTSVIAKRNDTTARKTDPPATGNVLNQEPQSVLIGPRLIGKNYILVQSYAANKLGDAQKLCDVLNAAGIPCSIEKVPPHYYNPDGKWVSVITRQGFTGISDRECKKCEAEIIEAIRKAKFDLQTKSLNVFQWNEQK